MSGPDTRAARRAPPYTAVPAKPASRCCVQSDAARAYQLCASTRAGYTRVGAHGAPQTVIKTAIKTAHQSAGTYVRDPRTPPTYTAS